MASYNNTWESYALASSRNVWVSAIFNPNTTNSYTYAADNTGNAFTLTGTDCIVSATVTQSYGSDRGLTFGECCSSQLKMTFYNPNTVLNVPASKLAYQNSVVQLWLGVKDDNGNFYTGSGWSHPSYMLLGAFYVDKVSSADGWKTVTIEAYDYLSKLNVPYKPTITFPATPNQIFNDIRSQYFTGTNTAVGYYPMNRGSTEVYPETELGAYLEGTVADYIGWLAGLIGTNAVMSPVGELRFKDPYYAGNADFKLNQDVQYMNGLNMQKKDAFVIHSLTSGTSENPITSGSGTGIAFSNPMMTQDILDGLLTAYNGFTYYPMSCEWRCYPEIFAGEGIKVQQADSNYYQTVILKQTISIEGGFKSVIDAFVNEEEVQLAVSPTEKAIQRVYGTMQQAIADATNTLRGANGGIFRITDNNDDGVNDGFIITDSAIATNVTRCIVANYEGIGLSNDGGATYTQAITHDGINASAITTGYLNAERIRVSGETLADYLDIGLNSDNKMQLTIGARDSNIRLAEVNDKLSFVDGDNNALLSLTTTTFDMETLQRFRLGNAQIVVQPNGSLSVVAYS